MKVHCTKTSKSLKIGFHDMLPNHNGPADQHRSTGPETTSKDSTQWVAHIAAPPQAKSAFNPTSSNLSHDCSCCSSTTTTLNK
mmetsp:Transcript_104770/g.181019  ORF Transcript_104770/g.181019 Transcript_104770/m.181019 type:complete len:83 (+) Transcript_104770:254-502(+)